MCRIVIGVILICIWMGRCKSFGLIKVIGSGDIGVMVSCCCWLCVGIWVVGEVGRGC